jgi:predicted transport protein
VANYTIEHILPQNPELPAPWRQALGENWKALQEEWLHRLGNLTLTGYNPELSDRPFLEKRNHEGGFATSPLQLNAGLGQLDSWGVEEIRQRGASLAERSLQVWPAPQLSEEQCAFYAPARPSSGPSAYTLDDHPHLANPQIRSLFDVLDAGICALDPNVYQEVLKLYIAYKCETNFVDIVPQAKRLRLSLNMPFAELDDPRGVATDISGIGRWGNGEVELGVASQEDVPYAIGLIRQSLERQLDDMPMNT